MNTHTIRQRYLDFFAKNGHAIVPSSAIIPQNDPTTLFTGSGMQPMIPYLMGQKHAMGKRITDSQMCFRADDIEEVGDNRHTTFFEMLGNWSLGDYFKTEQIPWMWDFLTNTETGLGLDVNRLYFTCFRGSPELEIDQDSTAAETWQRLFKEKGLAVSIGQQSEIDGMVGDQHIFYYPEKKNWWSRSGIPSRMPIGEIGGPDTEMFYDFDHDLSKNIHNTSAWSGEPCHVNCDCGRFIEIGNNVFIQYIKRESGFQQLEQKNVDFGGGLERMSAAVNDNSDVFLIDIFDPARNTLESLSGMKYGIDTKTVFAMRVIMDHLRAATFLIADGVVPSAKDQGYFTRRLMRRAVRFARDLGIHDNFAAKIVSSYIDTYAGHYSHLLENREAILKAVETEETKFRETLEQGIKHFEAGIDPFILYTTYGFPFELTEELAKESGKMLDRVDFDAKMTEHQTLSRSGGEAKFKGGLADSSEAVVALHTAHHLLLAALRSVLGDHVHQRGSNITAERLRIDFSHNAKMTPTELESVTTLVNTWIKEHLPVVRTEMPREEAEAVGAEMEFGAKYPDIVSLYYIGDALTTSVSREFCGGPHVQNTQTLGIFKIIKEEASSNGVRRIKAVLE